MIGVNKLTEREAKFIADALVVNRSLKTLSLGIIFISCRKKCY